MSKRWQAPGNAKGFNTFIGNATTLIKNRINANNRTIGTLKYIKEKSNESGFISEEILKQELKEYLYSNFKEQKSDSLVTHFYKPALFYGFVVRDKNYNLSLSIEGNLFINSYEREDFVSCRRILINQLDNTTYPNSATPDVKSLKLFPFRILFKLLLKKEKLSATFIKEKLVYISKLSDIESLEDFRSYDKFNSWVINSLVDINILDLNKSQISINSEVLEHIKTLYENIDYTDMFFESISCDINSRVANKRVKRDANLILKAKERDKYRCGVDKRHKTFIAKGKPYVEGHHIIPMFQQKNYDFVLDNVDNIISLCPNCHREIHFSDKKQLILQKIFKINESYMNSHQIDLNDFYKMYSCY